MRDLKALLIVAVVTAIIYWGVEPYAHSVMHPKVAPADYSFQEMPKLAAGNAQNGQELVMTNCIACHSIKSEGFEMPMSEIDAANAYGVVPPDLSNAGAMYDSSFLAGFIKDPISATKLNHKFGDAKPYPMPGYDWMSDSDIADMVAYLKAISDKDYTGRVVFEESCARCHSMKYDNIAMGTPPEIIGKYMGTVPPDLSMMIRSRGEAYLHTFINDPQKHLKGTAMPRVGLNEEAEVKLVKYIESIGDSKKEERESLGVKVIIFMIVMSIIAYFWKVKVWREVH